MTKDARASGFLGFNHSGDCQLRVWSSQTVGPLVGMTWPRSEQARWTSDLQSILDLGVYYLLHVIQCVVDIKWRRAGDCMMDF